MQINIVFGSASDKHVYEPLCKKLESIEGVSVDFYVCSAHRQPAQLGELIKNKPCDLYIAGAGLAAHLPGVVASQTLTPVIGMPAGGILDGLDAFLSILQMPKGVPVLAAGVEQVENTVQFISWYHGHGKKAPTLNIVSTPGSEKFVQKLKESLAKLDWKVIENSSDNNKEQLNIHLLDITSGKNDNTTWHNKVGLNIPIVTTPIYQGDSRQIMELAKKGGLWVGINNTTNILIALMQLWSIGAKEKALLKELKEGDKKSAVV